MRADRCFGTGYHRRLLYVPKGGLTVNVTYQRATADGFYVGQTKADPIPAHQSFNMDVVNLYAAYGVTDDLTVIASLPYINLNGNGEPDPVNTLREDGGIQDVSLGLKYRFASLDMGTGNLDLLGAVAVGIPGGYENNGILSLGSGAFGVDLKAGGQYRHESGAFLSAIAGYGLRGEAENSGGGEDFDVPNAVLGVAKVGYAGAKFYADAYFDFQHTTGGVDIMGEGFMGNFPETKVNFARLGATVAVPVSSMFSVNAGYSTFVDGRNLTDFSAFSVGATINVGGR